jgi:phospholipid/cholesterol/gamma-HCH transport system substrate-binding protein
MAIASKARWAQLKVGLLSMFALLILGYLIILMTGQKGLFQPTSNLYTFLSDSIAIAEGADVRLNGILIGKVSSVGLSGSTDPARVVRVTMEIDNKYLPAIPVDSTAGLAAQNLLGVKYINIKKGQSQQPVQPGAEIQSSVSTELTDLFEQGNTTLAALQATVNRIDKIISQVELGKGNIGKLLVDETLYNRALAITDEIHKLTVTLNAKDSSLGRFINEDTLYEDMRGTLARVNTLMDGLNRGEGTAGMFLKDPRLYDGLRMTIADVRQLLGGLNRGEGTAGKLLRSDELHEQFKATLGRMDALLDKINNGPGTVSQLLNNPQLYEDLDGTTRELQGMLRDFRANPKKFLTIRLQLF